MRLYALLDRLRLPGGYEGKFFLIGFVSVHVPLLAAALWALSDSRIDWALLVILLLATLLGTGLAFAGLHALLAPIRLASDALHGYARDATLPRLPTVYRDTGGRLLASVQETLAGLDSALTAAVGGERDARAALEGHRLRIAGMAHELRQPLVAVLGFSELMQLRHHGPLGHPDYDGFVTDILSSSQHMLSLLRDVERSGASLSNAKVLGRRAVALRSVAERAVRLLHRSAEAANVGVEVAIPDGAVVLVNDRVILQIFLNLLGNAVKHAGKGAAVRITAAEDGADLAVTVSDDGQGIPADILRAATEPFGGAQRVLRGGAGGSGFGLPLVKSLVETSGGRFAVRSGQGEGTVVTFCLPKPPAVTAARDADLTGIGRP